MKEKYSPPVVVSADAMEGKNIFPLGFAAGLAVGMAVAKSMKADPISRLHGLKDDRKKL